jgi:RNA-binding motif X-linked protein 2
MHGVCFAFQKGECTRGEACRFTHAAEGDGGEDTSSMAQSKLPGVCFAFQKGTCRRGASCRFAHDTEDNASDASATNTGGVTGDTQNGVGDDPGDLLSRVKAAEGGGVCFAFQKGTCRRGVSCRFSHDGLAA